MVVAVRDDLEPGSVLQGHEAPARRCASRVVEGSYPLAVGTLWSPRYQGLYAGPFGPTPARYLQVIDIVLLAGANPQQTDAKGRTPLDVAVKGGQFLVCPRLLDAGCGLSNDAPPAGAPGTALDPAAAGAASDGSAAAPLLADPCPAAAAGVASAGTAAAAVPAAASVADMLRWLGSPADEAGLALPGHPALAKLFGCEQVGQDPAAPTFLECAAAAGKLGLVSALLAKRAAQQQEGEGQRSPASDAVRFPSDGALLAAAVRGGSLGVAGWLLERAGGPEGAHCLLDQQPLLLHWAAEAGGDGSA